MSLGALLFSLLLFVFGPSSARQLSQQQTFTVRGTVVNSVTNEPVHGALVQFFAGRQRSQRTGPGGEFQFEDVPAGEFNVRAQKPGFFFETDIPFARVRVHQPLITVGPDQPSAVVKLIPEGLVFGRVTGDNGEPVESLPVQVLSERIENGRKTRSFIRSANTDEQGEFRVAELPPGKYFVFVGPSSSPSSLPANLSKTGARGYPAAFYPGVPDLATAAAVEVTPGKHEELNLSLSSQPFYRIAGTVTGHLQNRGINLQIMNAAGQPIPAGLEFDPTRGTFRTQWLPAGPCTLTAQMQDPETQQEYLASQTLNLNSDISGVHLALLPNVNIPVSFRLETDHDESSSAAQDFVVFGPRGGRRTVHRAPEPARVILTPQDQAISPAQRSSQFSPTGEEALVVPNVPPGVYSVEVQPTGGAYYAQSVRSGSLNLLEQNLTIAPGAAVQPIEVVLRDDFATLEGRITLGQPGDGFASVMIIPESAPQHTRNVVLYRPADSFQIPQLPPGNYRVLAVDNAAEFEYVNPDVLQKYAGKAQEIRLAPSQKAKVDLELVHVGD